MNVDVRCIGCCAANTLHVASMRSTSDVESVSRLRILIRDFLIALLIILHVSCLLTEALGSCIGENEKRIFSQFGGKDKYQAWISHLKMVGFSSSNAAFRKNNAELNINIGCFNLAGKFLVAQLVKVQEKNLLIQLETHSCLLIKKQNNNKKKSPKVFFRYRQ